MGELSIEHFRKVAIEEATRAVHRGQLITQQEIMRLMPTKTGTARRSMTATAPIVSTSGSTTTIRATVGSNLPYVRYLDEGTGIYGPRHEKITPKARKALSFVASSQKGQGKPYTLAGRLRNPVGRSGDATAALEGTVVVRSVKGIEPHRFVGRGFEAARDRRLEELRQVGPRIAARLGLGAA